MEDIYTHVGTAFYCRGRKTRAEAIAEARKSYESSLKRAQEFLATPEDEFEVTVTRGLYRKRIIEELKP